MTHTLPQGPDGHRSRLLLRFVTSGISSLHEYEIVELLLTYAIPRRDVKPIAKQLIARFGNLHALFNAAAAEIENVPGMTGRSSVLFSLIRESASFSMAQSYSGQSAITRRDDVEAYLRFRFGGRKDEYVAALFLDSGNRCLATEVVSEGTVNQCVVYPRTVVARAFVHGAAGVILAHNHPGGTQQPSDADWQVTTRLMTACAVLDMRLLDHLIILPHKTVSLRDLPRWPHQ